MTLLAQDAVRATSLNLVLTPLSKGINAVNAYGWYVAKTFLPTQLCIMYQHPRDNFRVLQFCGSAFLLALITGWVVCRWRRSPYLLTGWAWFLISLLPVIGLIQAGSHAYADRYTYLPHIGLGIMVVWQTSDWLEGVRSSRRWQAAFVVIVAAAFLVLAHFQIGSWRNASTLWHHAVTVNPEASLSQYRVAVVEYESGNLSEAENHLVRATELRHNYPEAWAALGGIYLLQKRWDLAEQASRKALDLDADNFYALKNLGSIATRKGDLQNAATLLKRAIQLDQKGSVDLRNRLGFVLGSAGDLPGALQAFESAVQLDPGNGNSQLNLGIALNHLDRASEAVEHLLLAVQSDPKNASSHAQLGAVLEKLHRPAEAASEYALAVRLNPNDQESQKRLELLRSKSP